MTISFSRILVWAFVGGILTGSLDGKTPTGNARKRSPVLEQDVEPTSRPSASPKAKAVESSRESLAAPNATILATDIVEFRGELPRVRKLIESALALTTQDLTYTYSSDDPANGGMDCSGFISYVLKENGFADVPRDASSQYVWLRKGGSFRAVLSRNSDTFELDDLRPGDLLFWTGTYATTHDPAVTHAMIYLGTEKGTKGRIMVGSSDGRAYHGKSRWGVSVFDFKLEKSATALKPSRSTFVGYARPHGLRD